MKGTGERAVPQGVLPARVNVSVWIVRAHAVLLAICFPLFLRFSLAAGLIVLEGYVYGGSRSPYLALVRVHACMHAAALV